jgi:hypothetical protein
MDNIENMMQQILAEWNANAKALNYQDQMLSDMKAHQAKMGSNQKKMLGSMAKFEEIMDLMKATLNTHTEAKKIDPRMMQSIQEHQDVPSEDVAVMPVAKPRKWRRVRKLTAGRRGEPKELNRGNHGSWKMLAAACRKVSCHATVAWRKRNLIRQIWTKVNCGPRKQFQISSRQEIAKGSLWWKKTATVNC